MINRFDIAGKTALVTGSSRGIGFTLAHGLAQSGAKVIINSRNEKEISEVVTKLKQEGLDVDYCCFDITDNEETGNALKALQQKRTIDILVNNAGIQIRKPLEDFPIDDWEKIIRTNLTGAFIVSKAVVAKMIQNKRGKIINICSLQSELGRTAIAPYAAAKGGLKMLTKAMTVEWAKHNIQVNGIGPGYFITEMTLPLSKNPEFDSWIKARTPAGRWGNVEELVGSVIFLASSASDFINGQVIYVDGGILAAI
jgi:gluconate 5-dehydrogenase